MRAATSPLSAYFANTCPQPCQSAPVTAGLLQGKRLFLFVVTLPQPHPIFAGFSGQLGWLLHLYFSFSPSPCSSGQTPSLKAGQASQFKLSKFGAPLPEGKLTLLKMKINPCLRSPSALRTKCCEVVFYPRWHHRPYPGKVGTRETAFNSSYLK